MSTFDRYIKELEKELSRKDSSVETEVIGFVQEVKDGVVTATGLDSVSYGELVEFEQGEKGMVIDLLPEVVGIVVLDEFTNIQSSQKIKATGQMLSVPVGDALLGRVVNPLGEPLDGGVAIHVEKHNSLERVAPTVVDRKSVSVPLQTGIKAIDALIPVGRGQRELIIGDRRVGKTTVALDAIVNQKTESVICIYCGIGQKNVKVASAIDLLTDHGAMDYTIVVSASAADPATMQYIAPYAACAIGEYFMDQGKDVLVVYDDLTKHAYAYRQLSLILRRPAGREAYPGDIFYLHSRLLERACRLNEKNGGGSLTALPIIETLENDISAYIPTNVISITDGQLFLEADLFNTGQRPAINVGNSVSRVGGSAQTKAMKKTAGKLKLELAQYREMAAFSQFASDLDDATKKQLNRGARTMAVLKQDEHTPYSLAEQIISIWSATNGYFDAVDVGDVHSYEVALIEHARLVCSDWIKRVNETKVLEERDYKELEEFVKTFIERRGENKKEPKKAKK